MNILILGPERERFSAFFGKISDTVSYYDGKLDHQSGILKSIDFIISYGYRHILDKELINIYKNRIINLHISFLPWNKGADPNLWSFLEDTPKGVTIHYIDEGLDTGDILIQKEISVYKNDTLSTTYNRLSETIESLLVEHWADIKLGKIIAKPQLPNEGSFHKAKDKQDFLYLLSNGWDTPVNDLLEQANKQ